MKKICCILLVWVLTFGLTGCAQPQESGVTSSDVVSSRQMVDSSDSVSQNNKQYIEYDANLIHEEKLFSLAEKSYALLFEKYTQRVSYIDEVWYAFIEKEKLDQWIVNHPNDPMRTDTAPKKPLLLEMITELEVSKEDCGLAVKELQSKYLPTNPLYFTQEDMDVLLCGDQKKIDKYFVSRYAVYSSKHGAIKMGIDLLRAGIYSLDANGVPIDAFDAWCRATQEAYSNVPMIVNILKDKHLKYQERYRPNSVYTMENTAENQWFKSYYKQNVTYIDPLWYEELGQAEVEEWARIYASNIKNGIRSHLYPDIAQMLYDLNVPQSKSRAIFAKLQDKLSPASEWYLSDADLDILLSYDIQKINERFAADTAVLANHTIYNFFWLINHSAEDYKAAGITAAQLEEKLPEYKKCLGETHKDYVDLYTKKINDLKVLEK